ncbi:MAG TPA: AI-2E family transporter [Chryseosolibacter sp.]
MKEIFSRVNQYLFFFVLAVVVMYFGRSFIIPIVFAALLAMLMAPLCRKLDSWGFPRALSTLTCVLILAAVVVGMGVIIGAQIATFGKDIDKIKQKGTEIVAKGKDYIEKRYGVSEEKQEQVVKEQAKKAQESQTQSKGGGNIVTKLLSGVTSAVAGIILTLVFTFLFIFSKEKYESFFLRLYKDKDQGEVKKVVGDISRVAQKYLTGRAMSITIIWILYSIGLSIVGIKNAILLAGVAALLTLIPYVGTVLGGLFPVFMALVTEDSMQPALMAVLVMFLIQTMDNYFIEPNIVGGEVSLSALTSILSIIAGGMIWGVAGMILFLPMMGIVKIICDHVDPLKPIGFVIGDPDAKKPSKITQWVKEKLHIGTKKKSRG